MKGGTWKSYTSSIIIIVRTIYLCNENFDDTIEYDDFFLPNITFAHKRITTKYEYVLECIEYDSIKCINFNKLLNAIKADKSYNKITSDSRYLLDYIILDNEDWPILNETIKTRNKYYCTCHLIIFNKSDTLLSLFNESKIIYHRISYPHIERLLKSINATLTKDYYIFIFNKTVLLNGIIHSMTSLKDIYEFIISNDINYEDYLKIIFNKDIILAAIKNNGLELEYIYKLFKLDRGIFTEEEFEILSDKEIIENAIYKNSSAIQYIPGLKEDFNDVNIEKKIKELEYIDDEENLIKELRSNPMGLKYISNKKLKYITTAILSNIKAIKYAFSEDYLTSIIKNALLNNFELKEYISKEFVDKLLITVNISLLSGTTYCVKIPKVENEQYTTYYNELYNLILYMFKEFPKKDTKLYINKIYTLIANKEILAKFSIYTIENINTRNINMIQYDINIFKSIQSLDTVNLNMIIEENT